MTVSRIALLFDCALPNYVVWWTTAAPFHDTEPQIIELRLPAIKPERTPESEKSENELELLRKFFEAGLLSQSNYFYIFFTFGASWQPIVEKFLMKLVKNRRFSLFSIALNQAYQQGMTLCLPNNSGGGNWGDRQDIGRFLNNLSQQTPEIVLDLVGISPEVEDATSCILGGTEHQIIRLNVQTSEGLNNLKAIIEATKKLPNQKWAAIVAWQPLARELSTLLQRFPNPIRLLVSEPEGITEYIPTNVHIDGETYFTAEEWEEEKKKNF